MAIGLIFQVNGVSQEQYERVLAQVCPDDHLPSAWSTKLLDLARLGCASLTSGTPKDACRRSRPSGSVTPDKRPTSWSIG
jgi:hypothetical protein